MSVTEVPRRGDAATEAARSIVCPNCGQTIRLDDALREHLAADLIARRESELRQQAEKAASEKIRGELEERQTALEERNERLRELTAKLRKHQDAEKQLLKEKRELEDEKQDWELERERMRNAIRQEEREQANQAERKRYEEMVRRKDDDHKTEVRRPTVVRRAHGRRKGSPARMCSPPYSVSGSLTTRSRSPRGGRRVPTSPSGYGPAGASAA